MFPPRESSEWVESEGGGGGGKEAGGGRGRSSDFIGADATMCNKLRAGRSHGRLPGKDRQRENTTHTYLSRRAFPVCHFIPGRLKLHIITIRSPDCTTVPHK